jgi:hypothetical protein
MCVIVIAVREGTTGRVLDALRGSEVAATSIGISSTRARIIVFALSAGIAGIGGGLLAMYERAVNYNPNFVSFQSLFFVCSSCRSGAGLSRVRSRLVGFAVFQTVILNQVVPDRQSRAALVPHGPPADTRIILLSLGRSRSPSIPRACSSSTRASRSTRYSAGSISERAPQGGRRSPDLTDSRVNR